MARGWESKSVEAQIDTAEGIRQRPTLEQTLDPVQLDLIRKKESLQLSRTHVQRQLDSAQNPRYRALLSKELTDLDAQLAGIG